ncbi:bifunctional phosphopantothenoylcysteine decarboxylase/phosphopantothenate--cysteine ligase CoaBC [Pelistega sp. NLN82]|uniref:Coenzyme A biosynthesis bifunctional protein CoaBC n=1 Tax=Pelistega ratti TaxID=2652177 RepID=A0A6L9Y849_9BURK|nr:bifunctional phosphopantothenoylcysteine decarboxylase/phosphopantothenate--cysteine ligase CoaBC [Pelistega ratti]NEN76375.1 bifunctional phosphopantothenoylcysteine decarboxylase/phosphopantothenate--cysteine ligase CoaBC [Pelistega ratti]
MMKLQGKHIVLGLTGGIACYKSAELCRRLIDQGAQVTVVMTEAATHFITPTTMQALSHHPVFINTQDDRMDNSMAHINLSRQADLILIAPCSADFIAKLAHGFANDLLSTLCLARGACPLAIVPAMNREMWSNPATQRNISLLQQDSIHIWGPANGIQACGETGYGRMLEVPQIMAECQAFFTPSILVGKKVLITAGPTEEPIDPVRMITNRSSGKMGYAIAQAAFNAGANVHLISGPTALATPYGVTIEKVRTAREMHQAVLSQASTYDIFISVAAVADWHIDNYTEHKQKKQDQQGLQLHFSPNPDILAEVAHLDKSPWCVGFAAETENLNQYAQEKRLRKGVPLLVGNLAQQVMEADTTTMVLFDDKGEEQLPTLPKDEAAQRLIEAIAKRYTSASISHLKT